MESMRVFFVAQMDLKLKGCQASEKENFFWVTEDFHPWTFSHLLNGWLVQMFFFFLGFGLFSGGELLFLGSVCIVFLKEKFDRPIEIRIWLWGKVRIRWGDFRKNDFTWCQDHSLGWNPNMTLPTIIGKMVGASWDGGPLGIYCRPVGAY